MSKLPRPGPNSKNDYPTSDGKPMAESDWHREVMSALIYMLKDFFADQPSVYVSGNLLLYYEEGNCRRRLAPDVFVVRGVQKYDRGNFLLWKEGLAPQVVIEVTSSRTKHEDRKIKWALYQNVLRVREYFLIDPLEHWLDPPLQGYRLNKGVYRPIQARQGRFVSEELGLHLERDGWMLRLWNPRTDARLLTLDERLDQAVRARQEAQARLQRTETRIVQPVEAATKIEADTQQMRKEIAELRRRLGYEK
jgi:Uma2 family endonuclease